LKYPVFLYYALLQTGKDKLWGKPEYFESGCGMSKASTLWLIEQGIRVMGTDVWGWARVVAILEDQ
jgi:kynurenine formamidase